MFFCIMEITEISLNGLGLGLVASTYSEETKRSEAIGRALGGGAVGVLLGYPTAGFLYHLTGKTVPFLLVTTLAIMLLSNITISYDISNYLIFDNAIQLLFHPRYDSSFANNRGKKKS